MATMLAVLATDAAIDASTAGSRFATFNTSGPTMTSDVETAIAVNVVQHSST